MKILWMKSKDKKESKEEDQLEKVTNHLKNLEETSKTKTDKISNTLSLLEDLTTDAQKFQEQLSKERDIWKATFDAITSLVIILDEKFRITRVNKAFIDYIEIHEQFIIGKDCKEILDGTFCNCKSEDKICPVKNKEIEIAENYSTCTVNERHFSISYSPIKNNDNDITGHVLLCYDITERINTHKILSTRDSIMTAVNEVSEKMLRDFKPKNGHRIQEMIEKIGIALNVDIVYIFKNALDKNNETTSSSLIYEWVVHKRYSQLESMLLKDVMIEPDFYRWKKILSNGGIIQGNIENFPESEQDLIKKTYTKSLLVIPIFVCGYCKGFISFIDCNKADRIWNDSEINALNMCANILGAWIERGRVERSLRSIIDNVVHQKKKLGQYLVERKIISEDVLKKLLKLQKKENKHNNP